MIFSIQLAVSTLEDISGPPLQLEGGETISRQDLLTTAAVQQELTEDGYCEWLRSPNAWGGGPEIVALSNALKRPIFVYEVLSQSSPSRPSRQRSGAGDEDTRTYL